MDSNGPRPYDFMSGYTDQKKRQYMNIGYVSSPYPGKTGIGDYGPTQGGEVYYRPANPTYPYLLDFSQYNPYQPSLAYAQDIPLRNRQIDMAIHYPELLSGSKESTPDLNNNPFQRKSGCSSCSNY